MILPTTVGVRNCENLLHKNCNYEFVFVHIYYYKRINIYPFFGHGSSSDLIINYGLVL